MAVHLPRSNTNRMGMNKGNKNILELCLSTLSPAVRNVRGILVYILLGMTEILFKFNQLQLDTHC